MTARQHPIVMEDEYSYPLHMGGAASTLPPEGAEPDVIARLHAVVQEVTGKPVERRERPRMGFLP